MDGVVLMICRWSCCTESGDGEDGERGVDGTDVLGEWWPFKVEELKVVSVQASHSSIVSTRIESLQMLYAFAQRSSIPPSKHADARVARAFAVDNILLAWYEYRYPSAIAIA